MISSKKQQASQVLAEFYQKPVAKVSLELFFSITMVGFFALFAIRPTLVTMSNLIKEIQDKQALDNQLKQKIAALTSAQTQFLQLQNQLSVLDEAIPSTPEFHNTLAILEKLASDRNLTIYSVEAKDVPKEATPSADLDFHSLTRVSRSVSLTVIGDFPTIRQYIEDIRNVRRTMTVDNIVFSVVSGHNNKRLQAQITISFQYFGTQQ